MKKATRPEEQSRLLQGQSSTAAPTKIAHILKQRSFVIETHRISVIDENGAVHHGVGLYVLCEVAE